MGSNLNLGIIKEVHLQLSLNNRHLKKYLSKNYTIGNSSQTKNPRLPKQLWMQQ